MKEGGQGTMEMDPDTEMFGYYLDLKRGWTDCENKIIALETVDTILEKVWLILEPDCEHLESSPVENIPKEGAVHKSRNDLADQNTPTDTETGHSNPQNSQMPPPILPPFSDLYSDQVNSSRSVNLLGANLRYVDNSTGTAHRNAGTLKCDPRLNKLAKSEGSPTPPHPPVARTPQKMASKIMDKFIKRRTTPQKLQKLTPSLNLQHNHKNAGKILKEEIAKRKFINKFKNTVTKQNFGTKLQPEAGVSELLNMKLRKVDLNGKCERKCGLTDENLQPEGGMKKQNFKDKLSKFKFLEAEGPMLGQ